MSFRFTDFVTQLNAEPPPGDVAFDDALTGLRKVLVYEMRCRGLWHTHPRYLGIFGGDSWSQPELLDELAVDCYEYIFLRRLPGLLRHAAQGEIESLVFLNVQHFLHDAQRRNDPLGYRVFEIAREAVERLVESSVLHLIAGDPKIRNDSILAFKPWHDEAISLDPQLVQSWNDSLMPDLVTAWHREKVVEATRDQIANLEGQQVDSFYFRDIVSPLKEDARRRWQALYFDRMMHFEPDGDDGAQIEFPELPHHPFEDRQTAEALLTCVARSIESSPENSKTREYLRRLLEFLSHWSALFEEGPGSGKLPSDRHLSDLLQIPRARIQGLTRTLGTLTGGCLPTVGADVSMLPSPGAGSGATVIPQEIQAMASRMKDLRRRTLEAAAQARQHEAAASHLGHPNEPGDLLQLPAAKEPVLWLLLDSPAEAAVRLAPVDGLPWVGSHDLALEADEPRVVRGGQIITAPGSVLETAERVDRLTSQAMQAVRRRLHDGEPPATVFEQRTDSDSEYQAWMQRLAAAGSRLTASGAAATATGPDTNLISWPEERPNEPSPEPSTESLYEHPTWPRSARLLAASLTIAVIGLSIAIAFLQQNDSSPPAVVLPTNSSIELRVGSSQRGVELHPLALQNQQQLVYLVFRDAPPRSGYRLRLLNADSKLIWSSRRLDPVEHLLLLPIPQQVAGCLLEIRGINESGQEDVIASYPLQDLTSENETP